MTGTFKSPLPPRGHSSVGSRILTRSSPHNNVETTPTTHLPSHSFAPTRRKRKICFESGYSNCAARTPNMKSCKKEGRPLKPPKHHSRSRAIDIPFSLVDTAPKLPSANKMDLPLLAVAVPPRTTVGSTVLTPPSKSILMAQVPLPRKHATSLLPIRHQRQQQPSGSGEEDDVMTKKSQRSSPKLPLKLQLPDLPDMDEDPGSSMILDGDTVRPPRIALAMKSLSSSNC